MKTDMVYRNNHSMCRRVAIAIQRDDDNSRVMLDYHAVSATFEQAALPIPKLESLARLLSIANVRCPVR